MKPASSAEIMVFLQRAIAEETKVDISKLDVNKLMGTFGLDSINSVYVLQLLEDYLNLELSPLLFWDFPTIKALSDHLYERFNDSHG